MGRIDCSLTLNYVSERNRMCETFEKQKGNSIRKCKVCPLYIENCECGLTRVITQKYIDIVQKWSDEHPHETMAEHFFKLFPNAMKHNSGIPMVCPKTIGWLNECKPVDANMTDCEICWNQPYTEGGADI